MLQAKCNIEILQVNNGFIVRNGFDYACKGGKCQNDDAQVFQSFSELVQWLSEHFSHRSSAIRADGIDA